MAGRLRGPDTGGRPTSPGDLAADWTDLESFSRPPPHGTSDGAGPEASRGHRKNNLLRRENELFYGSAEIGTRDGAIIADGNPYCPATPRPLLELGPLARAATKDQAADWERTASEPARYKPGRLTSDDQTTRTRTREMIITET